MQTLILLAIPGGMGVTYRYRCFITFWVKIPELMKGLGRGISEFKKGKKKSKRT